MALEPAVGIDLGTTGIRATLLGTSGEVLARRTRGYGASRSWVEPAAGEAQAEASVFRAAVSGIIAETLDAAGLGPGACPILPG